jgi:S-adenosylmethionine hydrolase
VVLENPDYRLPQVSATFHGRDIFAPAAAHLSLGLPLEKLGPAVHYRMHFPGRLILREQDRLQGEIIHVDRFGNLISNIEIPCGETKGRLQDLQISLATEQVLTGPGTYEEAPPLRPFALISSSGLLEVSVRNGSAHKITGCGVGTPVLVRRQR